MSVALSSHINSLKELLIDCKTARAKQGIASLMRGSQLTQQACTPHSLDGNLQGSLEPVDAVKIATLEDGHGMTRANQE